MKLLLCLSGFRNEKCDIPAMNEEDSKGFVPGFAICGESDSLPDDLMKHSIRDA